MENNINMKIRKITLKNFRGHQNTEMCFDENLTVVVGANGSGKSSILDGISICLSWIIARMKNPKGQGSFINHDEIYLGERDASLIAKFDNIESLSIPNKTKTGLSKSQSAILEHLNHYCTNIRAKLDETQLRTSIPIFAHYGVKRAVLDIPLRIRQSHVFDLFETYDNSLNGSANFRTFFEWFRYQEDIENEKYRMSGGLFGEALESRPDRELSTVRHALSVFLPEYRNIQVRRNPLQMVVEKGDVTLRIDQLSDGEKIYIALIGDLCRRLVLANPTLDNPLQGAGIVLIDELDLHLHPKWQTDIAPRLKEIFPNVQFIVTTHSPLVITNIPSDSLRVINWNDGEVIVSNSEIGYGLPTSVIMKDLMGLENELPREIELDLLPGIYTAITDGNIFRARELYSILLERSPELPELVRIRKLIELKSRRKL